jgi:hypothetical protein
MSKFHVPPCSLEKVACQFGPRASGGEVMAVLSICFRCVVKHPCQGDIVQVRSKCIPSASFGPLFTASQNPTGLCLLLTFRRGYTHYGQFKGNRNRDLQGRHCVHSTRVYGLQQTWPF